MPFGLGDAPGTMRCGASNFPGLKRDQRRGFVSCVFVSPRALGTCQRLAARSKHFLRYLEATEDTAISEEAWWQIQLDFLEH